jgi:hypothetical protein
LDGRAGSGVASAELNSQIHTLSRFCIALLRGKAPTGDAADAPNRAAERDDLGTAKGIMLTVAISAMIWGAVVLAVLALRGNL